ncbi:hypothetical protein ACFVW8_32275 [Streptomyces sp. NPDC058221]|uniref:hypothetical protein n=1 Tax=Streptomyces sp. NPDC058221 TaxID=3346388 RepID=UPI0036E57930
MLGHQQRFTAYRVLSRSYFHLTILFVFFYDRDFSLPVVEVALAAYGVTLAVAAVVVKPLAKRLSLTGAVVTGEFLKALGLLLLAAPGGLPVAVVAQVIAALGFSLASGTDSALLAEICRKDGSDARSWESRSGSLTFAAALVAGVLGAIVYQASTLAPFFLSAAMSVLAALTASTIGRGAPAPTSTPPAQPARTAAPSATANGTVLRWSSYYAVVRGFVLALFIGFLPYLLYVRLQVALPVFGLVLGAYTLSGFFTARYGRLAVDRFGARTTAAACAALAGAGLLILLWQPNAGGAAVATVALGAGVGAVRPVSVGAISAVLDGQENTVKAAALRANEARFAVVNTVLVLLAGLALDRVSFPHLLLGITVGYLVLAAVTVAALPRPARQGTEQPATA